MANRQPRERAKESTKLEGRNANNLPAQRKSKRKYKARRKEKQATGEGAKEYKVRRKETYITHQTPLLLLLLVCRIRPIIRMAEIFHNAYKLAVYRWWIFIPRVLQFIVSALSLDGWCPASWALDPEIRK